MVNKNINGQKFSPLTLSRGHTFIPWDTKVPLALLIFVVETSLKTKFLTLLVRVCRLY